MEIDQSDFPPSFIEVMNRAYPGWTLVTIEGKTRLFMEDGVKMIDPDKNVPELFRVMARASQAIHTMGEVLGGIPIQKVDT